MITHTLPRSGEAPLTFTGDLLAESDGQWTRGKAHNRWHNLAVYRTAAGKFILHIEYCTQWQGELGASDVFVCERAADVVRTLRDYNPTDDVEGYPPGDAYAAKQDRLFADVTRRYNAQVSELLAASAEFAERVE